MNVIPVYDLLTTDSHHIFDALEPILRKRGVDCELRHIDSFRVHRGWWRPALDWNPLGLIVQERGSGRYVVADEDDWSDPGLYGMEAVLRDPRCLRYLKAQYLPGAYNDRRYGNKVRPWTYREVSPIHVQRVAERMRRVDRTRHELFFRGKTDHSSRAEVLKALRRHHIMNADHSSTTLGLYLRQLSKHRLALSLPGHGNFCHREIEAFGIGTPVLMPVLKNQTHDPLVPNHHYIAVNATVGAERHRQLAKKIRDRYYEVIDDDRLLRRISHNAQNWYDRNVRMPEILQLTASLLGILPAQGERNVFESERTSFWIPKRTRAAVSGR